MYLSLTKPTQAEIDAVIAQCLNRPYSYPDVGATWTTVMPTALSTVYAMDHNRVQLGTGETVFQQAKEVLLHWRMCNLGWAEICGTHKPTEPGTVIACVPKLFGAWLINPCRVVYKIDERKEELTRFGLAYGTLPGHAAMGEERFLVEWYHADDTVWYDILAYSQPGHWLARIGYPVMRVFQKRYGRDSAQVMARACATNNRLTNSCDCDTVLETFPVSFHY
jgi:uncharacterized protein (UPF0548 family)